MTKIRADKRIIDSKRRTTKNTIEAIRLDRAIMTRNSVPVVVIQKPRQYNSLNAVLDFIVLSNVFSRPTKTIRKTVIIKENGGSKKMTENEVRDSIKKQLNIIIDDIYEKFENAKELKEESKYAFKISLTNPITDEVLTKKISLKGSEIIEVNKYIRKNPVKSAGIKRVLKKHCWKIFSSILTEGIF